MPYNTVGTPLKRMFSQSSLTGGGPGSLKKQQVWHSCPLHTIQNTPPKKSSGPGKLFHMVHVNI